MLDGWNAVLKLGAYVLTSNSEEMQKLTFEDILPLINECVRKTLAQTRVEKSLLFGEIKQDFKGLNMSFHIQRLREEFEQSHLEVTASQPAKNRQITMQHLP